MTGHPAQASLIGTARALLIAIACLLSVPAAADTPLEIQVVLPLTGSNSYVGNEQSEALHLLANLVNRGGGIRGRALKFVIHDSQSNPQIAVQLANQYIEGQGAVFIGDSSVATCAAIAAQVGAAGPVQFCLTPGLQTKREGYSFALGHATSEIAGGVVTYLRKRGVDRVGLIVATDATGLQMDAYFTNAFAQPENHDLTLVAKEHFNPSDLSVTAQIANVKAAGAQALIAYVSGAPFGTVLRAMVDVGLSVPVLTSQGNLSYAELRQFKDFLPKELLFVSGPLPSEGEPVPNGPSKSTQLAYLAAFRAAGIRPDFGQAVAWDTGNIVVAALRTLGANATARQIRSYVAALHGFPGVQGIYDFRSGNGHGAADLRILQWDADKNGWFIASGGAHR